MLATGHLNIGFNIANIAIPVTLCWPHQAQFDAVLEGLKGRARALVVQLPFGSKEKDPYAHFTPHHHHTTPHHDHTHTYTHTSHPTPPHTSRLTRPHTPSAPLHSFLGGMI